jgi:glutamate N-acetyltransferase / amino-acid N-acetyltransferase
MSVGLKFPVSLSVIKGIKISVECAKIYPDDRTDLCLIEAAEGSVMSAVFTQNLFCAAPVQIAKKHLIEANPRYCLINAGNANAGTGKQGILNTIDTCQELADLTNCKLNEVLPFSTGVIGEDLPVDKIKNTIPRLITNLSEESWLDAAEAIMTTDTIPKAVSREVILGNTSVTITGIAKGAGMIKPNMATMLSFIATDANITKELLDKVLSKSIKQSFNRITIDGDTSTNDACVLIATGKAANTLIDDEQNNDFFEFENAISEVCCELAQAIVRDGEGATKFITIKVTSGKKESECLDVAYKIAESPLVKTAFTASDPNWGRILAAIGNSGIEDLNINTVTIYLDDLCIVNDGQRSENYSEEAGKKIMLQDEIKLSVDLDRGEFDVEVWTTDLSHEYVTINAEYRT